MRTVEYFYLEFHLENFSQSSNFRHMFSQNERHLSFRWRVMLLGDKPAQSYAFLKNKTISSELKLFGYALRRKVRYIPMCPSGQDLFFQ